MSSLRALPSVDRLLRHAQLASRLDRHGRPMVTGVIRQVLAAARDEIAGGGASLDDEMLIDRVARAVDAQATPSQY